jgi:hypothetical protein
LCPVDQLTYTVSSLTQQRSLYLSGGRWMIGIKVNELGFMSCQYLLICGSSVRAGIESCLERDHVVI